ncbi:hypothetical protein CBL_21113 [Carabus blaptoides fortunei]
MAAWRVLSLTGVRQASPGISSYTHRHRSFSVITELMPQPRVHTPKSVTDVPSSELDTRVPVACPNTPTTEVHRPTPSAWSNGGGVLRNMATVDSLLVFEMTASVARPPAVGRVVRKLN